MTKMDDITFQFYKFEVIISDKSVKTICVKDRMLALGPSACNLWFKMKTFSDQFESVCFEPL